MHAGGDLLVAQKERGQNPFSIDVDVVTGSGTVAPTGAAARTNFQIYVQKITVSYITHANTKTITFQDDTSPTPVKIAVLNDLTAAAGVPDVVVIDFGPVGTALTISQALNIVVAGSGPAARIHIDGYYRLGATISVSTNTNTGTPTNQV